MEGTSKIFQNLHKKHSIYHITLTKKAIDSKYRRLSHDANIKTVQNFTNNEWMKKHGKGSFIDFSSKQRAKIRSVFKELDKDKSGALNINELYEPLLALGLVESKAEVKKLMSKVDTNGSGVIEFEEFVKVLKSSKSSNNLLIELLKNISEDHIESSGQDLPYHMVFSNRRRELMLQSYVADDEKSREIGKKVLNAYAAELEEKEAEVSKLRMLMLKKEMENRRMILRKSVYRLDKEVRDNKKDITQKLSRPSTASKKPMTRKEILNL